MCFRFADDSYGAYRNRSSRQVGTYKRSSSAAVIRPDNHHLKSVTDSQAVFSDRRLGHQNWNSDSQLQTGRRAEGQGGGPAGKPPDRAGNVPSFKADSSSVRSVGRVAGVAQPLTSQSHSQSPQSPARVRDEGKIYTARPFHVEQPRNSGEGSPQLPRKVKDLVNGQERNSSPLSPSSPVHTASSSGQRWANATPFQSTHRAGGGDTAKPQAGNSSSNHTFVPNLRPTVLTDSQQAKDRPPASPSGDSTQSVRPRVVSDRTKFSGMPSSPDYKQNQRFAEVAPMASDARGLPGHVRNSSQSSMDYPSNSSSSVYSRRESGSTSHVSEAAIAMVSPQRKSDGSNLSSPPEVEKESVPAEEVTISHGRQPSQEELECDQQAKELAREVADSEKKLSDVLSADTTKNRMRYMDGLFSGPLDGEVKTPASIRRHQSHGSVDFSRLKLRQPLMAAEDQADSRYV